MVRFLWPPSLQVQALWSSLQSHGRSNEIAPKSRSKVRFLDNVSPEGRIRLYQERPRGTVLKTCPKVQSNKLPDDESRTFSPNHEQPEGRFCEAAEPSVQRSSFLTLDSERRLPAPNQQQRSINCNNDPVFNHEDIFRKLCTLNQNQRPRGASHLQTFQFNALVFRVTCVRSTTQLQKPRRMWHARALKKTLQLMMEV